MRTIGFSTGALAKSDVRFALAMLQDKPVNAIELSALRQDELQPLVEQLDDLDLSRFRYKAFHAPSAIDPSFEPVAIRLLERVASRGWPIITHPDAIHEPSRWASFGNVLCIENMDKRKAIGQTAGDLAELFVRFPEASFCFDIGHARQVDPTMSEATMILQTFVSRLKQVHVSQVNTQSKHDALSFESVLAFSKVSHLVPTTTPIILESRVNEGEIVEELSRAAQALGDVRHLALAGD
jgi:hypothetical protein